MSLGYRLFLQFQEILPNLVHHQILKGRKDFSEMYLQRLNSETRNLKLIVLNVKS